MAASGTLIRNSQAFSVQASQQGQNPRTPGKTAAIPVKIPLNHYKYPAGNTFSYRSLALFEQRMKQETQLEKALAEQGYAFLPPLEDDFLSLRNAKLHKIQMVQLPQGLPEDTCPVKSSIHEEPRPNCGLQETDAELLAANALRNPAGWSKTEQDQHRMERRLLLSLVKTPWDILAADRAMAKALKQANAGASPEQKKRNHMQALFLRDDVGQCVINAAMTTWHGKRVMLSYVLHALPGELNPHIPAVRDLSGDGQLPAKAARNIARSFILNQPLKNRHETLEKVIGFQDMVTLEEQAIEALNEAKQGARTDKQKAQLAMNFLFLLHDVGTQTAQRVMTEPNDLAAYRQHLMRSLVENNGMLSSLFGHVSRLMEAKAANKTPPKNQP